MAKLFSSKCIAYDLQDQQYHLMDFTDVDITTQQNNIYLILNPEDKNNKDYPYLALIFEDNCAYLNLVEKTYHRTTFNEEYKLTNNMEFCNNEWIPSTHAFSTAINITKEQFDKIYRKKESELTPLLVTKSTKLEPVNNSSHINQSKATGYPDNPEYYNRSVYIDSKQTNEKDAVDSEIQPLSNDKQTPKTNISESKKLPLNALLDQCGSTGQAVTNALTRLELGMQNQTGFYGFFKWIYWYGAQTKYQQITQKIEALQPADEAALKTALTSSEPLANAINAKRHCSVFNLHRYFFYDNTSQSMANIQQSQRNSL